MVCIQRIGQFGQKLGKGIRQKLKFVKLCLDIPFFMFPQWI